MTKCSHPPGHGWVFCSLLAYWTTKARYFHTLFESERFFCVNIDIDTFSACALQRITSVQKQRLIPTNELGPPAHPLRKAPDTNRTSDNTAKWHFRICFFSFDDFIARKQSAVPIYASSGTSRLKLISLYSFIYEDLYGNVAQSRRNRRDQGHHSSCLVWKASKLMSASLSCPSFASTKSQLPLAAA